MAKTKVFCIGFQKTGTTSLGKALDILGHRVCGYWQFKDLASYEGADLWDVVRSRAFSLTDEYDAFKDTPWPLFYKELDELYPDSKFILVTRNSESWIRSAVNDFSHWPNSIHRYIYGVPYPEGNEDRWIERYEQHNAEVIDYFGDRTDFVHYQLNSGDVNWENLCSFLEYQIPNQAWPHENKKFDKKRRMFVARSMKKLRRSLGIRETK
jgi:hypothetical protein